MFRFLFILIFSLNCAVFFTAPSLVFASSAEQPADSHEAEGEEKKEEKLDLSAPPINVEVDVQERDGFTRVVFMPDYITNMEAEEEDGADFRSVNIGFSREGLARLDPVRTKNLKNIYDINIVSRLHEALKVKAIIPKSSRYRFFTIQKRAILDVFAPEDASDLNASLVKEKRAAFNKELQDAKFKNPQSHGGEDDHATPSHNTDEHNEGASIKKSAPKTDTPDIDLMTAKGKSNAENETYEAADNIPANTSLGETVITFSSTESFGMAVFERMGYLWAITDRKEMRLPPVIEGDDVAALGEPEEIEIEDATAYRFKLPPNAYVQPQGGGFIWKIKVTGQPYSLPSAAVRKEFSKDGDSKLILTLKDSKNLLRVNDPMVGDSFAVVTVPQANLRVFKNASFVDLDVLPAYVGAVLIPKSDGIRIEATSSKITVSRNGGLNIGPAVLAYDRHQNITPPLSAQNTRTENLVPSQIEQGKKSLFGFSRWAGEQKKPFYEEQQSRRLAISNAPDDKRRRLYMDMSEFLISNALPYEAVGYMDLVGDDIKSANIDTSKVPEYRALRAVALIGARRYKEALDALDVPTLQKMEEIKFWRSLALSGADRVDEAYDLLPTDLNFLKSYPITFRNKLMFELAEMALKAEDADLLQSLTDQLQLQTGSLSDAQKAGLNFYKGRLAMMNGLPSDVKIMLKRAIESGDLYYGTRAELALIKEQLRNEEITPADVLPRLERIRFAWRGDDIEAEINKVLGESYIANGEEQKGLNILRAASSLMKDKEDRQKLSNTMVSAFQKIYLDEENIVKLKPLEALAVFEEFSELLPSGQNGDRIIMAIVDKLASVELYSRSISLMKDHIKSNLNEAKMPLWVLKAAALSLLDRKPQQALDFLAQLPEARYAINEETQTRYNMIKAKAFADLKRPDEAFSILDNMDEADTEVMRLKADTAWDAGRWSYAAKALSALLDQEKIDANAGIDSKTAQLILNTAIAHNLAGNTTELAQVRDKYTTAMRSSPLSKSFQVVTRPVREAVLADRQTIMSHVFEADLFDQSLANMSAIDVNDTSAAADDTDG